MRKCLPYVVAMSIALIFGFTVSAQDSLKKKDNPYDPAKLSWRKDKKYSKELLKNGTYYSALTYLEAGAAKQPNKAFFAQTLAPTYLRVRDYRNANKWYKILVDADSGKGKDPNALYHYAMTQKQMGMYEQARDNFKKFRKLAGDDEKYTDNRLRANKEMEGCSRGIFYRDSFPNPEFKVTNMGVNINQSLSDFSPAIHQGQYLYYSSYRTEVMNDINNKEKVGSYAHIYRSMKNGKEWMPNEIVSENINQPKKLAGNPAFSNDGNTMYYSLCEPFGEDQVKCMIYQSKLVNGNWEKGNSVGGSVNDPAFSNSQPCVGKSKDGEDVLYFASNRNPSRGMDIYYAKINTDGSIDKPRPAGPQINSKGDEMSPFFDFKNNKLYFSSNGWVGIGGQDVFRSGWDANGEWTEPENMGTPVNSPADDVYFSINGAGTMGFLSSNRAGGFSAKSQTCCDDIYMVESNKCFLAVRGTLFEEANDQRTPSQNGSVILYDDRNGTQLSEMVVNGGSYFFNLEKDRGYKLVSRKDGFRDCVLPFNTDGKTSSDTFNYDLTLIQKRKGDGNSMMDMVIGKVYYDYDKAKLREDARDTLRKIHEFIISNPSYVYEVGGHTDGKGTEMYNTVLAKHRAEVVANYFIYEKKIRPEHFVIKSYGFSMPAAPNANPDGSDNPAGRALNRRTEFKIIDELKANDSARVKMAEERKVKAETKAAAKKDIPLPKLTMDDKAAPAKKAEPAKPVVKKVEPKVAKEEPAKPMVKKDEMPVKKAEAPKAIETPKATPANGKFILQGTVYTEKGGKRLNASDGVVFLNSEDASFDQKTFFIRPNGQYMFDLTRTNAHNLKVIARKGNAASEERTFNLDELRKDNKPIDLVIPQK